MSKRKRSVLMAVLTCVLCIALAAGGTYALFSDKVTLKNHLQAGTLDIALTRTHLKTNSLDDVTGFMVATENPDDVDFSTPNNRSVFDITGETLIVPTSAYLAEMKISNNSDVAFGYWLEIVFDNAPYSALADQLNVVIVTADGTVEKHLYQMNGLIGSETDPIGILAKSTPTTESAAYFTVSVEFLNLANHINNDAQGQELSFDLVVHAVQVTSAP